MKNFKIAIVLLTALISNQAIGASVNGTATATVLTPISVTAGTNLQFGSFTASALSGTITHAGVTTGGVTSIASSTKSAGTFTVNGDSTGNVPYTFTLPATVTLTSGANTMSASLVFASGTGSRRLTAGSETVSINSTLSVAANQVPGSYTGTYTVTTIY
jgi:hypothetical protein